VSIGTPCRLHYQQSIQHWGSWLLDWLKAEVLGVALAIILALLLSHGHGQQTSQDDRQGYAQIRPSTNSRSHDPSAGWIAVVQRQGVPRHEREDQQYPQSKSGGDDIRPCIHILSRQIRRSHEILRPNPSGGSAQRQRAEKIGNEVQRIATRE